MRLNVYLQKAGIGSRREAERMVADGRVAINGTKALATDPVEEGDSVTLDGRPVAPATKALPRLFMLNKPIDVLVTNRDHKGRKTVFDLEALQQSPYKAPLPRLMSVGRLDVNSEGLLLLSSDGPLAQAMMAPATALSRIYRVRIRGKLTGEQIARLAEGVTIDGISYRGAEFVEERDKGGRSNSWYRVRLTEGKNREIRKLVEHFGCMVNRLVRVQYGPFELGDLKAGELKEVPPKEVKLLISFLEARGVTF
jgi:23S rRNA pseudouridine2605 synthase